jgi:hypothetical protein
LGEDVTVDPAGFQNVAHAADQRPSTAADGSA